MTDKEKLQKKLTRAEINAVASIKDLVMATEATIHETQTGTQAEFLAELSTGSDPIVINGVEIMPPGDKNKALLDVQAATEKQRKLRIQYEGDRSFFEHKVLSKTRGLCEIQEDYIKVLHPHYREKFMDGVRHYGTVAAAMKWMKDNHGLKLRGDILRRIALTIPSFKQEIDDAQEEYQATIHMEMHRRAVEGIDKGIYHNGEMINTEKVYSDSLLVKMADTHNPEYKEAKTADKGRGGNIVNVQIIKDFHNYKE